MYLEVPVCTRCCFCLPLRYGLIVWGYLKLLVGCLVLTGFSVAAVLMYSSYGLKVIDTIIVCVGVTISFIDVSLSIMYIVGCHKKNLKIMKIYYFYSTILLAIMASFSLYLLFRTIYSVFTYHIAYGSVLHFFRIGISECMTVFANIALQVYMIILIKSEIVKLESRSECRFVNNAADAQCTLNINDNIIQEYEEQMNEKMLYNDDGMRITA